ncbi:general secretion pathway protein N [Methylomarinovum tepidoasis]|uniref:General secretion pathway protein N n=1 Tax=Methylomarinovum tepidoasis TaxID=2840183 RepID=A0AAU9C7R9_9GAMM|nr:hypothetical protein [Methylomarinovum sp. IN45]BCX89299.1 general secretion pathway protein N [Methylomarinovum sp. IN45]
MSLHRKHWPTIVLGTACLGMAMFLAAEYTHLRRTLLQPQPGVETPKLEAPATEPAQEFQLPPLSAESAFVSRPLFLEGRRPVAEESADEPTPEPAAAKGPPPEVELIGILETPETRLILLRDKRGKVVRLHPDETIDGWRLQRIEADHVVLTQNGQAHTLKLVKPRKAPKRRISQPRRTKPSPRNPFANPFTNHRPSKKPGKKSP